jgi:hypothetical protein
MDARPPDRDHAQRAYPRFERSAIEQRIANLEISVALLGSALAQLLGDDNAAEKSEALARDLEAHLGTRDLINGLEAMLADQRPKPKPPRLRIFARRAQQ